MLGRGGLPRLRRLRLPSATAPSHCAGGLVSPSSRPAPSSSRPVQSSRTARFRTRTRSCWRDSCSSSAGKWRTARPCLTTQRRSAQSCPRPWRRTSSSPPVEFPSAPTKWCAKWSRTSTTCGWPCSPVSRRPPGRCEPPTAARSRSWGCRATLSLHGSRRGSSCGA